MRKLFRNPKKVVYVITAFVVLLLVLWSIPSRGDSELRFEAGSAVIRGETPVIGVNISWPEQGPVNTSYEAGFMLIGESTHYKDNPNVIAVHAVLVDGWKKFQAGIGFYGMNVEHEYTCQFGFHLLARWEFTERINATWRHYSSAGSCKPNAGRDLVSLAWRF